MFKFPFELNHLFGNPQSELPLGPQDQIMSWQEPDTGRIYHFNSTSMFTYWKRNPDCGECAMVPISQQMYEHTKANKGIEPHRLERITKKTLRVPTLWIEWEIDTKGEAWHVCIDGSHRIVWAYEHGIYEVKGVIFKKPAWSRCQVIYEDKKVDQFMPNPNTSFSGIF